MRLQISKTNFDMGDMSTLILILETKETIHSHQSRAFLVNVARFNTNRSQREKATVERKHGVKPSERYRYRLGRSDRVGVLGGIPLEG